MNHTRQTAVEKLLLHYQEPYLCTSYDSASSPLAATAFMHLISERKFLSLANAGMVESDDFVYIYSLPELTEPLFEQYYHEALDNGIARVDPNPNHQFSLISVLFLCDTITPDAALKLKKTKYYQKFKKPASGTIDLRLAAVEVGGKKHAANAFGKSLLNIYKKANKSMENIT